MSEREYFEEWISEPPWSKDLTRREDGDYKDLAVHVAWVAWQARADLSSVRDSELIELLRVARCPDSSNASHEAHPCPWCHERDDIIATHAAREGLEES